MGRTLRMKLSDLFVLLNASYAGGKKDQIRPGQLVTYRMQLMQKLGISDNDIRRIEEALISGRFRILEGKL